MLNGAEWSIIGASVPIVLTAVIGGIRYALGYQRFQDAVNFQTMRAVSAEKRTVELQAEIDRLHAQLLISQDETIPQQKQP